jgi:hypothetical protein
VAICGTAVSVPDCDDRHKHGLALLCYAVSADINAFVFACVFLAKLDNINYLPFAISKKLLLQNKLLFL